MIFDIDNWKEITATLARNKTRTFLTAFGIFWGTAMLALLWGSSQGLQQLIRLNFDGFASNSAILIPQRTTLPYKGYQKGMSWNFTIDDVENMRRIVPELEVVSPLILANTTLKYNDKTFAGSGIGLEPNYMDVIHPIILKGRFINEADLAKKNKVCVLGEKAANRLFGAEDPIGKFVQADNIFYRVVGVAKQRNEISMGANLDESIAMPMSTLQSAYNFGKAIHFMAVIAKPGHSPTELRPKIYRVLRLSHPLHPNDDNNMFFMDISKEFERLDNVFIGVDVLILFVGISSLIAGIIGVGNIMWIIVKERTKEFGIRRAIGAKPANIMRQILAESAILTLVAGTGGICFSVLLLGIATPIIAKTSEMDASFQLTFSGAVIIMALFLVLGSAAGTIPAIKAMKIKPIEALNDK